MFWATTFAIALLRERDKEWTLKRIQLRERYVDIKRERENIMWFNSKVFDILLMFKAVPNLIGNWQ